jgi:hypothetical protein
VLIAECGELQRTKTIQFETANALQKERTTKITNKGDWCKNDGKSDNCSNLYGQRNNVDMAINIAREARQILGNGNNR